MLRNLFLAAAAAVVPLLLGVTAASAAPAHAVAAPPPCAAGSFVIGDPSAHGYIAGNGVNEPVVIAATGNCFTPKFPFPDPLGGTGYEYQNGYGHCLFQNYGIIELGANACAANHPNEEFYGHAPFNGQYLVSSVVYPSYDVWDVPGCGVGSPVQLDQGSYCDGFTF